MDWSGRIAQYMNLGADSTSARGALLAVCGNACQSAAERYMGRALEPSSDDEPEVYDGNGKSFLYLRRDPIISVSSLTINGTAVTVGDPTAPAYPPADVVIRRSKLVYTTGGVFTEGIANILVTYSAGLDAPEDLVLKLTQWAAFEFKERDRVGLTSENLGGQSFSISHEPPKYVREALDRWKRPYAVAG